MIITEPLNAISALAYHGFTYPTLQYLLTSAGSSNVTAIGVREGDARIGLALAIFLPAKGFVRVVSVFIKPEYRDRGYGQQLLTALETELRTKDCHRVEMSFQAEQNHSQALQHILAKLKWPLPQSDRLICHTDRRMLEAEWLSFNYPLSDDFEIFLWSEVDENQLAALRSEQESDGWIPESLLPWNYQDLSFNSVGMRYKDNIIGWVLNQKYSSDTLIYSNSYMRPDMQKVARILPLYQKAVLMQATSVEFTKAVWVVPYEHPGMVRFVKSKMGSYMSKMDELRVSIKELN